MDPKEVYMSKPWLKYYPEGVRPEIDVQEISVPDLFDQMADQYSSKVALIFYGKKIPYGKLKELTNRFAAALADLGVTKGDTVALYLLNLEEYLTEKSYSPSLLSGYISKNALSAIIESVSISGF